MPSHSNLFFILNQGGYIFEGTIKVTSTAESFELKDKYFMKKQMKEFKDFQVKLQKRKKTVIKSNEAELGQLIRIQERNWDMLNRTQTNLIEKKTSQLKKAEEDFLKRQAKELKEHEEEVCVLTSSASEIYLIFSLIAYQIREKRHSWAS